METYITEGREIDLKEIEPIYMVLQIPKLSEKDIEILTELINARENAIWYPIQRKE